MIELPNPEPGQQAAAAYIKEHLAEFCDSEVKLSPTIRGGQSVADEAMERLDLSGYAEKRFLNYPKAERGATVLSPYLNSGLISLPELWERCADAKGSEQDIASFKNELLWQEYSRHWLAALGPKTKLGLKRDLNDVIDVELDVRMACVAQVKAELETDGYLTNESRLWFASHWTSSGNGWQSGERYFYRHLVDGSRATNRLGWQWASGVSREKQAKLTRWHVENRAPGICQECQLCSNCPVESEAPDPSYIAAKFVGRPMVEADTISESFGPLSSEQSFPEPELILISTESMGRNDPASLAAPNATRAFVFDEDRLREEKPDSKRLGFWVENLSELSSECDLKVLLGSTATLVREKDLLTTFIPDAESPIRSSGYSGPVAGWRWLVTPKEGKIQSFSAWRRGVDISVSSQLDGKTGRLRSDTLP